MRTSCAAAGVAAAALAGLALGWLRTTYSVVTVRGDSMSPTYADGDRLLVRRPSDGRYRRDQVIVFRTPVRGTGHRWLVKRVQATGGELMPAQTHGTPGERVPLGQLVVRGDNAHSLDSRHFGPVPAHTAKGVVVRRIGVRDGPGRGGDENR